MVHCARRQLRGPDPARHWQGAFNRDANEERAALYAMASDDKDRLWFVETGVQPNRLVGFDPRKNEFFGITDVGSGGGTIRHMTFDKTTGLLWFGTDNGTIGRAVVSPKSAM